MIKARGCCANCYDTPMRKGYKRGSKEWTQCLVEIRARMDPLFQPAQGKEPEKAEGLSPDPGASQAPAQEVLRDRPKGEAPVLEKPFDPAAGRPGAENGLRVEFLSKSESVTSPAGSAEERRDEESKAEFPRYLSLFFDFEESKDRGLYAWLRARAAANRRGVSAEIMSILDSIINQEESRRKMEKDFAEFAARAQRENAIIAKDKYDAFIPDGRTTPAAGVTSRDRIMLAVVIGFAGGILSLLAVYLCS
ncbi:MAG: hypothetical protein ABIJ57_01040 [Pseudomonadota bacterium]